MQYTMDTLDGTALLRVSGRLVFSDADVFRELITKLKAGSARRWTLDVSGLEFIDSGGLGMLLMIREAAEQMGTKVVLQKPAGQVKKALELSRFSQLMQIEP